MRIDRKHVLGLLLVVVAATAGPAPNADAETDSVQASLLADAEAATPGGSFTLGVRLKMKPHWHTYWVNPGEYGTPTRIKLAGPSAFEFGEVQWPLPTKIDAPGGLSYGYEEEVLLLVPVKVSQDVKPGGDSTITADVSWLSCKEACVPGKAKLTLALPVRAEGKPANRELFDTWRQRLPVPKDQAPVAGAVAVVEHDPNGSPKPGFVVRWKKSPRKVEWFPVSTKAIAIEDVGVDDTVHGTHVTYKPTVFKPDQAAGGRVEGVLVYEDAAGKRRGVNLPVTVPVPKEQKQQE